MITINENIANKEYETIMKNNNKLINGVLEEKKISFILLIGFIGFIFAILMQNNNYVTEVSVGLFILLLIHNQKIFDNYIDYYKNNESNQNELIKILATLSKDHYKYMYIKAFFIIGLCFFPSLSEFSLMYSLIYVVNNFYYSIFPNKYSSYSLIYLFRRVDMYFENKYYKDIIDSKFNKYYGK